MKAGRLGIILGLGIWLFLNGCQVGEPEEVPPATINQIEVEGNIIKIYADRSLQPGAFVLYNPTRLIITVSNCELSKKVSTQAEVGGLVSSYQVKEIKIKPGGEEEKEEKAVRIIAFLNQNITYQISSTGFGAELKLEEIKRKKPEKKEKVEIPKELYPKIQKLVISPEGGPEKKVAVPVEPGEEKEAKEMLKEILPEPSQIEKLPPAKNVTDITYRSLETSFEVIINGDGEFKDYRVESLTRPERIVIDIFGAGYQLKRRVFSVNTDKVRQIRVGIYPDKTRVVVELKGKTRDARIVAIEKKILVKIIF